MAYEESVSGDDGPNDRRYPIEALRQRQSQRRVFWRAEDGNIAVRCDFERGQTYSPKESRVNNFQGIRRRGGLHQMPQRT